MFSMVTVASSTNMPTASARPPRVMMLRVSPVAHSATSAVSTESGMEMAMMTVERQLPRKSRIIRLVSAAARGAFAHHALDRRLDENRLVGEGNDLVGIRQLRLQLGQLVIDSLHHIEGGGRAILHDGGEHGAGAVDMHHVLLRRKAVADMADIAHEQRRPVHCPHRQIVEVLDGGGGVVERHRVLEAADLGRAHRGDLVLRRQGVLHVGRRQAIGLHRLGIEIDHDLALAPARGGKLWRRRARW